MLMPFMAVGPRDDLTPTFDPALEKSHVKETVLAAMLGHKSHHLLRQAVKGERPLDVRWLLIWLRDEYSRHFLMVWLVEVLKAEGLDLVPLAMVAKFRAMTICLMDEFQKRMPVKADLRESAERESA